MCNCVGRSVYQSIYRNLFHLEKTFESHNYKTKVARIGESILYILVDFWWILAPIVIGYFKPSLTLFSLNNNWISIKELKFNSDPKTKVP